MPWQGLRDTQQRSVVKPIRVLGPSGPSPNVFPTLKAWGPKGDLWDLPQRSHHWTLRPPPKRLFETLGHKNNQKNNNLPPWALSWGPRLEFVELFGFQGQGLVKLKADLEQQHRAQGASPGPQAKEENLKQVC